MVKESEAEFKAKVEANIWEENLDEVIAVIKDLSSRQDKGDFSWNWSRCKADVKYISLHIDMRDGGFQLLDRRGKRISLDELKSQYGDDK